MSKNAHENSLERFDVIEIVSPPDGAIVRNFACYCCDREHLKHGDIAWVLTERYSKHAAAVECVDKNLNRIGF